MTEGQDASDREAVKNIGPSCGPGNQYDKYRDVASVENAPNSGAFSGAHKKQA